MQQRRREGLLPPPLGRLGGRWQHRGDAPDARAINCQRKLDGKRPVLPSFQILRHFKASKSVNCERYIITFLKDIVMAVPYD